ncbi:MAG: cysteine desulfurase, partial [Actinomycetota bacterium]|nr:cysteine desulfurase [Actinomycetota bacterium]
MQNDVVYLDHAATTPLDERVLEAMLLHLGRAPNGLPRGNPSSLHAPGAFAREAIEEARASVARLVCASDPGEIVFTAGGTESDNLAILGLAAANSEKKHVVISEIEHPAVREAVGRLEAAGYEVTSICVDVDGLVSPDEFARALRPDTALAAVMWANNEVGSVQPVEEIAAICREAAVPLHVDAVQAAGRLPIDVSRVPVATLALSAHKLYGPQGVGALYVRSGVDLEPVLFGGGQEKGLRSGTENVAGIAGFGVAARLAFDESEERMRHEEALREALIPGTTSIPGVRLNGHREKRLSNNVHVSVEGVEAESLVLFLDALGCAVGSGSACASSTAGHKASPVLLAMARTPEEAISSIRVTVGKDTTLEEVDTFLGSFASAITQLRKLSPLYT